MGPWVVGSAQGSRPAEHGSVFAFLRPHDRYSFRGAHTPTSLDHAMASHCRGNRGGRDNDESCVDTAANERAPENTPDVSNGQRAEEVLLFMTLNSDDATSRGAAQQDGDPRDDVGARTGGARGLGHREVLHLSDPDWDKTGDTYTPGRSTYADTLGQEASQRVTWWESDASLSPGQVKIDGKVYTLGTGDIKSLTTDRPAAAGRAGGLAHHAHHAGHGGELRQSSDRRPPQRQQRRPKGAQLGCRSHQ